MTELLPSLPPIVNAFAPFASTPPAYLATEPDSDSPDGHGAISHPSPSFFRVSNRAACKMVFIKSISPLPYCEAAALRLDWNTWAGRYREWTPERVYKLLMLKHMTPHVVVFNSRVWVVDRSIPFYGIAHYAIEQIQIEDLL